MAEAEKILLRIVVYAGLIFGVIAAAGYAYNEFSPTVRQNRESLKAYEDIRKSAEESDRARRR